MDMSFVQWVLAGSGIVLQAFILVVMIRRNLRVAFPGFFTYTAVLLASMLALLVASRTLTSVAYFNLFWGLQVLALALSFAVFREVFVNFLKPFDAVIDLGRMLFWWAALFLFFAAIMSALVTTGSGPDRIATAICLVRRSIELMQCGLLLLLVVFEKRMGVSWRSPAMCIALGVGSCGAFDLAVSSLEKVFPAWQTRLDMLSNVMSISVLMLWAVGLTISEYAGAPAQKSQDTSRQLVLQRWNEALGSYGYGQSTAPSSVESFLPGIEKTVERVMARSIH